MKCPLSAEYDLKTPIVEFYNEKCVHLHMHSYNNIQDKAELHGGTTKTTFLSQPCHCIVHNDKKE